MDDSDMIFFKFRKFRHAPENLGRGVARCDHGEVQALDRTVPEAKGREDAPHPAAEGKHVDSKYALGARAEVVP